MAGTRDDRAGGRPSQRTTQKAKLGARDRSPKLRSTRRRADSRRRLFAPVVSVSIVLAVVAGLVAVSLSSPKASANEAAAPASVVSKVSTLTPSVLSRVGVGQASNPLESVPGGGPLTIKGKPVVVFVSEESCPFCAAERWPLVIALSHFGTWGNLGATTSSGTDVYPGTATFSFRNATYTSPYLTLRTTELTDNAGHPLQAPTALDTELINRYDVPPYVNSAAQSGAVPFLDIDNHYILAGAQYDPQVLAGLSMSQIAAQLDDPTSPVARAVDQSANVLIAAINQVLHRSGAHGPSAGGG